MYSGAALCLAAMYLADAGVCFISCYAVCTCGTEFRCGPPATLPGEGVWRHAGGDGAHCPSTARHAAFNYQKNTRPKLGYLDWI